MESPRERKEDGMSPEVGLSVTHRRYVTYGDAHYGGNLVNGAFVLELFGDVGTEASIRMDGDEGLLASYSDVQFRAPVLAGDVIEVTATVTAVGRRSRQLAFEARVVCRADPTRGESAASVLSEPVVVATATGRRHRGRRMNPNVASLGSEANRTVRLASAVGRRNGQLAPHERPTLRE